MSRSRRRVVLGLVLALCSLGLMAGCGGPGPAADGVPGGNADEIGAAYYRQGVELFDAGNYRKALGKFRTAVRYSPADPQPYIELGACYARLGDPKRELAAYDEAIAAAPDFVPAYNARGVALLKLKRTEEAVGAFEQALKREVEYEPAHVNIAIAYYNLGRYELALMSLDNAAQFGAAPFEVASNRGLVLGAQERYGEAAEALAAAVAEKPGAYTVRFELAMALKADHRPAEAIVELERISTIQPEFASAYIEKGRLLAAMGEIQRSLMQYADYLSRVPKDGVAWKEMGNIRFRLGQYERAETCFRYAVKYRGDLYNSYMNLALTLEKLGRQREAGSMRRKAQRYKPDEAA